MFATAQSFALRYANLTYNKVTISEYAGSMQSVFYEFQNLISKTHN